MISRGKWYTAIRKDMQEGHQHGWNARFSGKIQPGIYESRLDTLGREQATTFAICINE